MIRVLKDKRPIMNALMNSDQDEDVILKRKRTGNLDLLSSGGDINSENALKFLSTFDDRPRRSII